MKRNWLFAASLLACATAGARADAGVYSDDLARCFVKSLTSADHAVLVRWMFSALAMHPAARALVTVTPDQRDLFANDTDSLYERLMYVDCRKEAIDALKYEGRLSLTSGFKALGAAAAQQMSSDPNVAHGMTAIEKYSDKTKFAALFKEAGVPLPATPPATPTPPAP